MTREEARSYIIRHCNPDYPQGKTEWERAVNMAIKALEEPERKKGEWIDANDGKWNTVEVLKCSACGEMDNRMYRTDNYCPNCGADMRGEQDE